MAVGEDGVRRAYAELVVVMAASPQRAAESGESKEATDVTEVAEETGAVMDGPRLQWVLDPRRFDLAGRFRACADRLPRSITTRATGLP
ncbi:TetR family transcriptional regulator C-terminal domain-containing protein [Streptomyces sp. NPDC005820]|uniref:TetR family transcriptional regulator C-terminal domain-containing protein n=1 Tax=Streptomyces sp. NPDC005820 TaxID=3157069 RepID=UPI0033F9FBEC